MTKTNAKILPASEEAQPAIEDVVPQQVPSGGKGVVDSAIVGDVMKLVMVSPPHKHLFISDLEWLLMPPLVLGQCRLIRQLGNPIAFVSWALLGPEAEERMARGVVKLQPADWRGGDSPWIIDVIAPFGGADVAIKDVRERVFAGRKIKTLQPAPDGKGMAVVEW